MTEALSKLKSPIICLWYVDIAPRQHMRLIADTTDHRGWQCQSLLLEQRCGTDVVHRWQSESCGWTDSYDGLLSGSLHCSRGLADWQMVVEGSFHQDVAQINVGRFNFDYVTNNVVSTSSPGRLRIAQDQDALDVQVEMPMDSTLTVATSLTSQSRWTSHLVSLLP